MPDDIVEIATIREARAIAARQSLVGAKLIMVRSMSLEAIPCQPIMSKICVFSGHCLLLTAPF